MACLLAASLSAQEPQDAQGTAPDAQGTAPEAQGTAPEAQGTAPDAQGTPQGAQEHHHEAAPASVKWTWSADANVFFGYNHQNRKFLDYSEWESQNCPSM